MVKLWAVTLLDLIQSMISEHAQKEIEMKKEMDPEDIRLAGGALMVGALLFVISLASGFLGDAINTDLWAVPSILIPLIIMPLFAFGMLAMRNRYGEKVGGLGENFLLIGAVLGALTSITGLFTVRRVSDLWFLIYTGPAVLFTGLALFGIVALYKKPLPRWNVAPVIAGIGYPAIFFFSGIPESMSAILIAIQGIALVALGYILKSDVPEETVVAPA